MECRLILCPPYVGLLYTATHAELKRSLLPTINQLTKYDVLQLGVFLCMRCATIHRKLGTHISKVKSLSMDSWTNEQVEVRLTGPAIIAYAVELCLT
jgi:hypothetical protein